MLCKIADLITEVPEAGDLVPRCKDYLYDGAIGADIIIRTDDFRPKKFENLTQDEYIYLESGTWFYGHLLRHDGMKLHASCVEYDGRAYLFTGPCGTGKSTHTGLWQQLLGDQVCIINDDKPALRRIDGKWYAYGTPWCGKDGINVNKRAPIGGICLLKQAPENKIRRLSNKEALQGILWQTLYRFSLAENLDRMIPLMDSLLRQIPVFEFENRPELEAARMSVETMTRAAEEMGL